MLVDGDCLRLKLRFPEAIALEVDVMIDTVQKANTLWGGGKVIVYCIIPSELCYAAAYLSHNSEVSCRQSVQSAVVRSQQNIEDRN